MACEFCNNKHLLEEIELACRGWGEVRYCPICGEHVAISSFIINLKKEIERQFFEAMPEIVLDENGKPMRLEREPVKKIDPPPEPVGQIRNMGFDLDNINIDRELELLKAHRKPSNSEILAKHIQQQLDWLKREEGDDEV